MNSEPPRSPIEREINDELQGYRPASSAYQYRESSKRSDSIRRNCGFPPVTAFRPLSMRGFRAREGWHVFCEAECRERRFLLQRRRAKIDPRDREYRSLSEIKFAHTDGEVRQEMGWAKCDQRHVLLAATARPC
jgi:hypothetical protein